MEKETKEIAYFITLLLCFSALGYLINELINTHKMEKKDIEIANLKEKLHIELENKTHDGLRFEGNFSHPEAIRTAIEYDATGDWVCVNIKGIDYERAVQVCKHETFHEIWAECGESNNLTYCINKHDEEIINGLE